MKNIYSNIYKPNLINLKKAKKNIENNNVIGMPTETVYGLAGNAYSDKSIRKIFILKRRPSYNPLIIHYKNLKMLRNDIIINNSFLKFVFNTTSLFKSFKFLKCIIRGLKDGLFFNPKIFFTALLE